MPDFPMKFPHFFCTIFGVKEILFAILRLKNQPKIRSLSSQNNKKATLFDTQNDVKKCGF